MDAVATVGESTLDSELSPLLPRHGASGCSSRSWSDGMRERLSKPLPSRNPASSLAFPLTLQCLLAGLSDASAYSVAKTWLGFMTGNMVQLVISVFELISPHMGAKPPAIRSLGEQGFPALASSGYSETKVKLLNCSSALAGFVLGCKVAKVLSDRYGPRSRALFVFFSIARSLLTISVLLMGIYVNPEFSLSGSKANWTLLVLSIPFGVQSSLSSLLATPFSTTVVFTATLTNVASELQFPTASTSPSSSSSLRPLHWRSISILALLTGAAISQTLINASQRIRWNGSQLGDLQTGVRVSLVGVALTEILLAYAWLTVEDGEREEEGGNEARR
ncbi:hypothetical protein IE53DRAFT_383354 [Violaceomyces palustris]|uniref:Uncharacterized protein n=1 Tax=Violaceomyces palustris TaxID=1673888 RepID=A0ACD0P7S3_9BASI|nr:hypothetical protein IE53DRAFT_383354 [Violaceomyces palustris]